MATPINHLWAQIDTFVLKEHILKTNKSSHNIIGTASFNIPLKNHLNLSDALKNNSAMHIKEYGLNGLSTLSVRGMSAQHTAIYWNNFNLQSCMNGLIDLNLLPSFFIDNTEVNTSSCVSSPGSGSLAGALFLKSNNSESKNLEFQMAFGSFHSYDYSIGSSYQIKKWNLFKTNLLAGIEYYEDLFSSTNFFKEESSKIKNQIEKYKSELIEIEIPSLVLT